MGGEDVGVGAVEEVQNSAVDEPVRAAVAGSTTSASPRTLTSSEIAFLAGVLTAKLRVIPHHAISLRRNKYRVVRRVAKQLGWDIARDKDASIAWLDKWETADMANLRYFKVGHFQAMRDVSSKCALARSLNRIRTDFPLEYDFHPVSFVLPTDKERLRAFAAQYATTTPAAARTAPRVAAPKRGSDAARAEGGTPELAPPARGCWFTPGVQPQPAVGGSDPMVYIVKPDTASRGIGIYLALTLEDVREFGEGGSGEAADAASRSDGDSSGDDAGEKAQRYTLVQAYLPRPLLMDGRKFDLRIYVLVTSTYPTLRVYIYRQGLVRLATQQYEPPNRANIAARRMFLTNYAVNKPADAVGGTGDDIADDESDASDTPEGDDEKPASMRRAAGTSTLLSMPPRPVQHALVRARDGCKWSLDALLECLASQGVDTITLWARIKDVITKTLLAIRPQLAQRYRAARPHLRKQAPPPAPPAPRRRGAPAVRPLPRVATQPAPRQAASLSPRNADAGAWGDDPPVMDSTSSVTARAPDTLTSALAAQAVPNLAIQSTQAAAAVKRSLSATSPRDRMHGIADAFALAAAAKTHMNEPAHVSGSAVRSRQLGGLASLGAAVMHAPGAVALTSAPSVGFGLVGTSVSLAPTRPVSKLDVASVKMSRPPRSSAAVPPAMFSVAGMTLNTRSPALQPPFVAIAVAPAPAAPAPERKPTRPRAVDADDASRASSATAASSSAASMSSDVPPAAVSKGSASSARKSKSDALPVEEEDGEQGFRCYELMGLDIILDMSHCTCAASSEYQRVSSAPASAWPADTHRCQPRPVLLEINQSCSLHSDSDLDRVLKGDVVLDALSMAAPDEEWLTQRFLEVLHIRDSMVAAPAESAGVDAAYDAVSDAARLSKSEYNDLAARTSFDAIPLSHEMHAQRVQAAEEAAVALMRAYADVRVQPHAPPRARSRSARKEGDAAPASSAEDALALPLPAPEDARLPVPNNNIVPHVPVPSPLLDVIMQSAREELWFGVKPADAAGASPAARPQSLYALGSIPPLSRRAQLVLVLRRIYEALHAGGFQPLLPPPTPQLQDRYRAVAEHVPLAMRETVAFARRRQEALALRAALEQKGPGSRW